ncbi:MAG: acetylglutamate kinase [Myxococcota bacterium]|nr:acetylglutamate kinase [Myxococcota bacterium]
MSEFTFRMVHDERTAYNCGVAVSRKGTMMMRDILLLDAIPYLRAYQDKIFVVKLGGELAQDTKRLRWIARDIATLHRLNIKTMVVHGGGPQLDEYCKTHGLNVERIAGRRVTSPAILEAAKKVFRGDINLRLVQALAQEGEKALGLSGVDGLMLQAKRRPPVEIKTDAGEMKTVDFGEVGDIVRVDTSAIEVALEAGLIPVLTPLVVGENGDILNCNADTAAAQLAVALGAEKLVLVTNVPGILRNPEDKCSLMPLTDLPQLDRLDGEGMLQGGMRPKVVAVKTALEGGIQRVHLVDSNREGALLEEIFTNEGCGTMVVKSMEKHREAG